MRRLYKSKLPDVHIPDDLSLTELLLSSARSPPVPETQIIAKDTLEQRTLTLGELRDSAGRLAQGLTGEYRPRDQSRWALVLPNCVTILEAFHAVLWLGGVACPINHQLKAGEIAHALSVSNPQYIIVYSQVVEKVVEAVGIAKSKAGDGFVLPKIITAVDEASSRPHSYPFLRSFLATERLPVVHHRDTRTRLGSIHLSSGTTGNDLNPASRTRSF
jgi:acyl-CoA synthetase (AMP-forming)/AMP-acid ligase II